MGFIQGNSGTAGVSSSVAFTTQNVTAGNLLISIIRCNKSGFTSFGCSDNVNGTWTVAVTSSGDTQIVLGIAYFLNSAGGSKPTVTWTGFSGGQSICIGEYSGVDTLRTAGGAANGNSASPATGTISTLSGDLIIGAECAQTSSTTTSSSVTLREGSTSLPNCYSCFGDASSAGGNVSVSFSITSTHWAAALAAFYKKTGNPNSLMMMGAGT